MRSGIRDPLPPRSQSGCLVPPRGPVPRTHTDLTTAMASNSSFPTFSALHKPTKLQLTSLPPTDHIPSSATTRLARCGTPRPLWLDVDMSQYIGAIFVST